MKEEELLALYEKSDATWSLSKFCWITTIISSMVFQFILCPLMIKWYESNDRLDFSARLCQVIKSWLPTVFSLSLVFVLSAIFSHEAWVPEEQAISFGVLTNYNETMPDGKVLKYYKREFNAYEYFMVTQAFIGNLFFMLFCGIGFVALPYDMFVDYQYRPKQLDSEEFERRKTILLINAQELREVGKELNNNVNYVM